MTQVQRSLATLGVVALLAGGAGGYAWWSNTHDAEKQKADDKAAALFDFDPAQVNALTIAAHGDTTVLQKGPDGWRITSPIEAPADATAVEGVLSNLKELKRTSTVEDHGAAELAKYGLDKPSAKVTVGWPGGGGEVALGLTNSFSSGQYAQRSGSDAIVLLSGMHDSALGRGTFDLRDKRLAILDPASVKRVEVDAEPDHYVLERDGQGWKVTSPKPEKADPDVVNRVLGVAENLRATSVADEKGQDLAKYGLDKPAAKIVAVLADGKQVEVTISAPQGTDKRTYARSSTQPLVAQVPTGSADPLHQSLAQLEDKTIAHVDREQVMAMQFTTPSGESVRLLRKKGAPDAGAGDTWTEVAPKSGNAKRWKVSSLLYLFTNLKAAKVVAGSQSELARYGLDKPTRTASLQDVSGKSLAELKFGKDEGSETYVAADGDPRIFALETSRLGDLPKNGDELLDTPPVAKN